MDPNEILSKLTPDELKFVESSNMRHNLVAIISTKKDSHSALESVRKFISMVRKPAPQQDSGCESCQ